MGCQTTELSRNQRALHGPLRIYRAAQELARDDRPYRFAGGHGGRSLSGIGPRDPLDCSSAASLLLLRAGVLAPGPAWLSGEFAEQWSELGEGRYVTLCARPEHVWIDFSLDSDHRERFDPTPLRLAPSTAAALLQRLCHGFDPPAVPTRRAVAHEREESHCS